MKDKNLRICKAAAGRVLIDLIDRAENCGWTPEQLGATIRAVRIYISDAEGTFDNSIADSDAYGECCAQIDRSESRSRKARERWLRKKSGDVNTVDEVIEDEVIMTVAEPQPEYSVETPADAEPMVVEEAEQQPADSVDARIVPPGTGWNDVIAMLAGIVELPKHRPVYPKEVPDHLRAYGLESYEEYIRSRYYAEGLRGEQLENRVGDLTFRMEMKRKQSNGKRMF